jgi:hypothetical protein
MALPVPGGTGQMEQITETLVACDNEFTNAPYWMIIDTNGKIEISGFRDVAQMITGPFFCRQDATDYLKTFQYNFSDEAKVFCKSGHQSTKYLGLWRSVEKKRNASTSCAASANLTGR